MLFGFILGATVFASVAMMVREGVWNNTLALIQILLSSVIAMGLYQPLVVMIDEQLGGEYTYALDIVVLWGVYVVAFIVLKLLCEKFSKTRMRFPEKVDDFVGPLIGLIAGACLAGFVGVSLHVAPLPRDGLGGAMNYTESEFRGAPIYALDATWLKMYETASNAGFAGPDDFSAWGFVKIYGDRRARYEETEGLRVDRGGGRRR
ncbi:MAG: CvpA family protein [Planctomycetota bacterium]